MNIRPTSNWTLTRSGLTGLVAVAGIVLFLATIAGAYAQSGGTEAVPATPEQPTGTAIWMGMMDVEWNEAPGAETYEVQYFNMRGWVDLPGDGITIAFYGAGAVVSGLKPSSSYTFRVRAVNSHGESDWSDFGWVPQTDRLEAWRDTPEPTNVAATGVPTISGTVETGETLTADVSGISDDNGLDRVRFHYQWIRSDGTTDTDIAGATNSSYTLTGSDAGNAMKVRVSFTDRQGFAETLTSAATAAVPEPTPQNSLASGQPTISGMAQVGETLTGNTSGIADEDGLDNVSFSYQWMADDADIAGATGASYTLTDSDQGKTLKVRVSFTDDAENEESLTSAATAAVSAAVPSAPRTVEVEQGGTGELDVSWVEPASNAGSSITGYKVQWKEVSGSWDTAADVSDATTTDTSYTITGLRLQVEYTVRVVATNSAGDGPASGEVKETADAQVSQQRGASENTPATGAPTIIGTLVVGQTLSVNTSAIADGDGMTNATFAYQWISNYGSTDTDITGATDSTHVIKAWDLGNHIKVRVSFTDDAGNSETLTSTATAAVSAAPIKRAPFPPSSLRATASHDSVVLTWRKADALFSWRQNVTGYVILRWDIDKQGSDGFTTVEEDTGTDETTYTDESVEPDSRYIYRVRAINSHGTSLGSDLENVLTPANPAPDPTQEPTQEPLEADSEPWIGIDISPASIKQWTEGDVVVAITGLDGLYGFRFRVVEKVAEDVNEGSRLQVDIDGNDSDDEQSCELRGLGIGNDDPAILHAFDRTTSPECKVGAYSLTVVWSKYSESDGEYQYGGEVTKDFEVIVSDDPPPLDESHLVERVDYITPLYPEPPAIHTPLLFMSVVSPGFIQGRTANVGIGVGGLHADSDPATTDYVVSLRVVNQDNEPVAECNKGVVGGSYLLKTVQRREGGLGRWGFDNLRISGSCTGGAGSATLVYELLNGSYQYLARHFRVIRGPAPNWPYSRATGFPTITGTARVGETLRADTSGILDDDGLDNVTFSYQWIRNDGTTDTDIAGATSASYVVTADDVGKTLKVRVSFTDDAEYEESMTSVATAAVSAAVPGVPRTLAVERGGTGELDVSWEEPSSNGGSAVTGYTVQWKEASGSWDTAADVSEATVTDTSYTITGLRIQVEYAVRVIATNSAGDGPASGEVKETADAQASQQKEASENTPATGAPAISGILEPGQSLNADTSSIGDADGLTNPAFVYQWLSDDTDITGATSTSYTLTDSDQGKTIKVRASFTDDAGNEETLTSEALVVPVRPHGLTAAVSDGAVVLTWNPPVGFQYLYDYQVLRNRPELGETEPIVYVDTGTAETTYTDTDVDPGALYVYRVKAANYFNRLSQASEPVEIRTPQFVPTANSPATGAPTISGTAQVGETLTANTSGIADGDGLTNPTFVYQWLADDTDISGATGSAYILTDSDQGKAIKVRASFTDDAGNEESVTSAATDAVVSPPTTLTASIHDAPESHDGENSFTFELRFSETPVSNFSYETLRDQAFTASGGTVTNARRLDPPGNVRWEITVQPSSDTDVTIVLPETADCDDQGAICTEDGRMLSAEAALTVVGPVEEEEQTPPQNNPATGARGIYGTMAVGGWLGIFHTIEDADGLENATFEYQWIRNDGNTDQDITGATGVRYKAGSEDEGKTFKVRVSFTDDAGNPEELTSEPTPAIGPNNPATGSPIINGTPRVGETLTADISSIADADGMEGVFTTSSDGEIRLLWAMSWFGDYDYGWLHDYEYEGGVVTPLSTSPTTTFDIRPDHVGKVITAGWGFVDDLGTFEFFLSAPTVKVAATVPDPPQNLEVSTGGESALDLTWEEPTWDADSFLEHGALGDGGSPITGYKVQWKAAASSWDTPTDVSEEAVAGTTHTITGLTDGAEYTVRVISTNGVGDGPPSAEATGTPRETVPPELATATVDGTTLTLTYNEALDEASGPAVDTFSVTLAGVERAVDGVSVAGDTVTLTLASAVTAEDTVTVSYAAPTDAAAARILDEAGNAAASFSGQAVTNNTEDTADPLTASLEGAPETHNGADAFTFEIRFSEEPDPDFSYKTLRDHAFTVTGGSVKTAQRLQKDPISNIGWLITVEPGGNGDVTIVLPVTTDCDAAGAVCTEDGRKLSNSLNFTVSGPGQ